MPDLYLDIDGDILKIIQPLLGPRVSRPAARSRRSARPLEEWVEIPGLQQPARVQELAGAAQVAFVHRLIRIEEPVPGAVVEKPSGFRPVLPAGSSGPSRSPRGHQAGKDEIRFLEGHGQSSPEVEADVIQVIASVPPLPQPVQPVGDPVPPPAFK